MGVFNISNYRAGTVVHDLDGAVLCCGADVAGGSMTGNFVYLVPEVTRSTVAQFNHLLAVARKPVKYCQ